PGFSLRSKPLPQRGEGSKTPTVDFLHRQPVEIDVVDAAGVDRDHFRAVGPLATGERLYAAGRAEQVMDIVAVELVFGHRTFALQELEVRCRHERQKRAEPAAA